MFTYCTQILHLAEHAAYNRIEAARAARRFPLILYAPRRWLRPPQHRAAAGAASESRESR
jgi:hypothetical protein